MQFFFETLSIIVLSLAAFLLAFLIILNLYLIKRNGFYVSVNCWFCNTWSKVLYNDRNSFDCPSCNQYNGFREDGSYNKIIEAQHNTSFTKFTYKTEYHENGLCTYCNNNQQLKIYQLAKFTPINEKNYDLEIEHFRKQLENAYKLCRKCDQVLKSTLNTQHSWIFGNRLKDLRKKGFSVLNRSKPNKQVKNSSVLKFIRCILILSTIFILCHTLNVKIVYPHINLKKHLPEVFNPYKTILSDCYHVLFQTFSKFGTKIEDLNVHFQKNMKIHTSNMTLVTCVCFLFDFILSNAERRVLIWKINGVFGWMILIVTFSMSFSSMFTAYISGLQIFSSLALLYNYICLAPTKQSKPTKECHFKKLSKPVDASESSEDETDEEIHSLNVTSKTSRFHKTYSNVSQNINNGLSTAKSVTSTSKLYNLSHSSSDLNRSLDNLHLSCASPIYSVNSSKRRVLSPAKLKNVTQNPWTAGGFWKNDVQVHLANVNPTNLSRSSSQSSGFVSNHTQDINSLPASREPSLNDDVDCVSILSEPAYHFTPITPSINSFSIPKAPLLSPTNSFNFTRSPQLYYKADNNTFYPVLSQNNMLFIQNGIPQQSFGNNSLRTFGATAHCPSPKSFESRDNYNVSLRNFDTDTLRSFSGSGAASIISPSLFSNKPVSGLFKNLKVSGSFTTPQC